MKITKRIVTISRNNADILISLYFTLMGLYIRFKGLANRELWCDEKLQLSYTVGPFRPIWQRFAPGEATCFPGDYLLCYPFANLLGSSKWLINIPHYIATLLGFYFMYLICRKYLKTHLGFAVAFLVLCFNGNLVYHSFEFRPYAVLPTLSLASFYFSDMIVSEWRRISALKKVFIGIFFVLTIIYHAYGIIIVGLCMAYSIISEAGKRSYKEIFREMISFLLPTGLLGLLLFNWFASGSAGLKQHFLECGISTFQYYPNPVVDVCHFFRQVFANLMAHKQFGQKHLALGIWIAFLLPQKYRFKQIGFFLLLIFLPIQLILLLDLFGGYWFLDRQFVWVMSLYAFFLGWCWDTIFLFVRTRLSSKGVIA